MEINIEISMLVGVVLGLLQGPFPHSPLTETCQTMVPTCQQKVP